jgi:hypothetical protein
MDKCSTSFLSFSTPQVSAKLNSVGVSLGSSLDAISVSTKVLKHLEFDRLKFTPVSGTKSSSPPTIVDDDEA